MWAVGEAGDCSQIGESGVADGAVDEDRIDECTCLAVLKLQIKYGAIAAKINRFKETAGER